MARVGYRTVTSDRGSDASDVDFGERIFVIRFGGFTRTKEGGLVIKDQAASGGREGTVTKLYWQAEIVWPPELRGISPGLSTPLKGIQLSRSAPDLEYEDLVDFTVQGEWTPYLLKRAQDFGFNLGKIDPDDPLYDSAYLEGPFGDLVQPLSIEQILTKVLEPKMLEADRWVRAKCFEGTSWIDAKTMSPLSSDEQAQLAAQIAALPGAEQEETTVAAAPVSALKQDLLARVRELAHAGVVKPSGVLEFIQGKEWSVDATKPLLTQLSEGQLEDLLDHYQPSEESPAL